MENAVASSRSLGKAPGADPSASETHSESQLSEMDTESPAFYMNVMKVRNIEFVALASIGRLEFQNG
jgi:hypothetical protein